MYPGKTTNHYIQESSLKGETNYFSEGSSAYTGSIVILLPVNHQHDSVTYCTNNNNNYSILKTAALKLSLCHRKTNSILNV